MSSILRHAWLVGKCANDPASRLVETSAPSSGTRGLLTQCLLIEENRDGSWSPLRYKFGFGVCFWIGCTRLSPDTIPRLRESGVSECCWTSGLECFEYGDDSASVLNWMACSEDARHRARRQDHDSDRRPLRFTFCVGPARCDWRFCARPRTNERVQSRLLLLLPRSGAD